MRRIALAIIASFFAVEMASAYIQSFTYYLRSYSNDYMTLTDKANKDLLVITDGRWKELERVTNTWLLSDTTQWTNDNGVAGGQFYFFHKRIKDFYQPDVLTTNMDGMSGGKLTNYYCPYSNNLYMSVTGLAAGANAYWWFSGYPSEFTNASAFKIAYSNNTDIEWIPTGTYAVGFSMSRGYARPPATSISVNADRLVYSTNTYLAYSNSISMVIIGYPAGDCVWSVTGPDVFTNALEYGVAYTNNRTISGVPTGTYSSFNFPGVLGYTTPTNTLTITEASPLVNVVTGVYVLAYPTNIPTGTGIQKFYQPSYFFTNLYLHDSGLPVSLRLQALETTYTNEIYFWSWLSTNTYVHSNSGNWAGTWQGHSTSDFASAGAIVSGTITGASIAASSSDSVTTNGGHLAITWDTGAVATVTAHTNLTGDLNGDTNHQHVTTAEKLIATNLVSFVDGSNTVPRAINETNLTFDLKYNQHGFPLGTSNDCYLIYSNGLPAFYFVVGGVLSNAGGPER